MQNQVDGDEVLDPEAEEQETETHEEEETEYVAPTKEEWAATQAALSKANAEAKKYRLAVKAAKSKQEASGEEDDEKITAAQKAVEDKYRPMIVKTAVKASLKEAGLEGPTEKLLKLIDVEDFDIDDDGNVDEDDLARAVESLKDDFPQLFPKKRAGRVDLGREATGKDDEAKDTASLLAKQIRR